VQNLQKLDRGLISKKHRGFFAKFPEILINELFSNGKGRGPGPRVRGPAGHARSTVDRRWHGQRVPEHQSSPAGAQQREEHGELGSGLTGARAAAWRPGNGGAEPEAATLGEGEPREWREVKRSWERCGELRGWCSPFIGVGGAPGRGGRGGLTPVLMALMPLKTGEGLRGESREGK
jgi:hypothetical protein